MKNKIYKNLVWLNVNPDDKTYNRDNAKVALERLKNEYNLKVKWAVRTKSIGLEQRELYIVEGKYEYVVNVETIFYKLCNKEAKKEKNKIGIVEWSKAHKAQALRLFCVAGTMAVAYGLLGYKGMGILGIFYALIYYIKEKQE